MVLSIAVSIAAVAWTAFVIYYTIRAKWWKNAYGRNTMLVSAVLAVILLRISILRWWPHLAQHDWVGVLVYSGAAIAAVRRFLFVEHAQREAVAAKKLGYTRRSTDV